jgi:hypothetical protein
MSKTTDRQNQMFSLVEECNQSELTRKEFCKLHSLSINCFYYWQKKYRQQIFKDRPGFIRVHPGNGHGSWPSTSQPIVLTYPNGVSLQLPVSTPLPVIGSLLRLV